MAKFEIYKDAQGDFRWRFQAHNGRILAESGEGYNNQANCEHAILLIKQQVANAAISSNVELDWLKMAGSRASGAPPPVFINKAKWRRKVRAASRVSFVSWCTAWFSETSNA